MRQVIKLATASLIVLVLAACSPASDGDPDAGDGGSADGPASGVCPPESPGSGACSSTGLSCLYPTDVVHHAVRCDCVGPEGVWMCCEEPVSCPDNVSKFPWNAIGQPCCLAEIPGAGTISVNCTACYPSGQFTKVSCSLSTHHWVREDSTCNYAGGSDAGAGPDSGGSDAGSD